jgi:hypothetical protein
MGHAVEVLFALQIGLDKKDLDKAFIQLTLEFVTKQVSFSQTSSPLCVKCSSFTFCLCLNHKLNAEHDSLVSLSVFICTSKSCLYL